MNHNITGALIAALAGLAVAFVNYLISVKVLTAAPEKYSVVTVLRQALQVGFLVAVYFVGAKTQLADTTYLTVGAVAGMTLPMIFFTKKLVGINQSLTDTDKKGEDKNG